MPNASVMMMPYCSGSTPSCCATGSSSGARITMVTKLSSIVAHQDRDQDHRRQEQRPRRGPPIVAAIAVVTPSSVSAHEKIVAALTV